MKLAHIADLHCSREQAEEALASLRFFAEHIKTSPVDLVCIAGDVWDASMLNTEASGFNRFVDAIREIADLAPIAMIYGTPSHDTDGSLEVFRKINTKHGITILDPGQAYFQTDFANGLITEIDAIESATAFRGSYNPVALLFGIPEPRKKYLLAGEASDRGPLGKDDTEAAVRDAMHRLCFHLAAKRREYPDIPCVVLYHGDVAGSVLQNDETVERGTGISVTIDDLNDISANYYALGHIHKPQQVGTLPAYYAGSIYPKNFGETHQAGFNVVEIGIEDGDIEAYCRVDRVDFPHPQNLKLEHTFQPYGMFKPEPESVKGRRVWLEITCGKEERATLGNPDRYLESLLQMGADPGSRVTVNELPVETVRAGEIAKAWTPEQKFEIWAENAQQNIHPFCDKIFAKINLLAKELQEESGGNISGEWSLESVRLRGATGIRKGIGKEEIAVSFDSYEPGLIALCGANGKGKTTLIENCHPYPQLLTRKGKLQDHFCLRDGFREVVYQSRRNEGYIKFLIQIDGQNKSGACKYFAFTRRYRNTDWEPVAGVDGNLKPYEEYVQSVFGPLELFLRTAFTTQRPSKAAPDLTEATAGEKKALFVELAGIEYLQRFAEAALARLKEEQGRAHDAEIRAGMLEGTVQEKPELEADIKTRQKNLSIYKLDLKNIIEQGQTAKAEVERLEAAAAEELKRELRERAVREGIVELVRGIESDQQILEKYEAIVRNRSAYEEQAQLWDHYAAVISAEVERQQQFLEETLQKEREFSQKQQDYQQLVRETEQEHQKALDGKRELERMVQAEEAEIRFHEREAQAFNKACPTCGQELPADKLRELTEKRDTALSFIETHREEIRRFKHDITTLEKKINGIADMLAALVFDEPKPEEEELFEDTALREAQVEQGKIDITEVRDALLKAAEAEARIEQLDAAIKANQKSLADWNLELSELEAGANLEIVLELRDAREKHAVLTAGYTEARESIARREAELAAQEKRLDEIKARETELGALRETLAMAKAEGAEWDLIARGFGRDGIQALELDALAPGIAETANRILSSAYGDRFKVAIETTRIGGAGKKVKQIEDFVIKVIDSEDGEAVNLEDKSGGEAVWIKRAIYDAFAVIRKRNTGFSFLTCFQDEADGALDSAAKTAYFAMLSASHRESNLRHTIVITHSQEALASIDKKICMEDL